MLETVVFLGLSGIDARWTKPVSWEFARLARTHPDLLRPAAPPGGWPQRPLGPGQVHWRHRQSYRSVPGLLVSWAHPAGPVGDEPSFMCVECGCWDDLQGEPWDERLTDEEGWAITPRDAADARAWLHHNPRLLVGTDWGDHHWSGAEMRRYCESVLAVWPGDVCRECYNECPDPMV